MKTRILSLYDWFLIVGVIVTNIVYSVLTGTMDLVGSVAGITGVLCVVLVAKGKYLELRIRSCQRFIVCVDFI